MSLIARPRGHHRHQRDLRTGSMRERKTAECASMKAKVTSSALRGGQSDDLATNGVVVIEFVVARLERFAVNLSGVPHIPALLNLILLTIEPQPV
jgi:hypothetical protein